MKNKWIAALAAIFLGGFGVHKLYLERYGQFALSVLFCWTLIPLILSFFEGIYYMITPQQDFEKEYAPKQKTNNLDRLEQLARLKNNGAITEEEFLEEKQKIMQK